MTMTVSVDPTSNVMPPGPWRSPSDALGNVDLPHGDFAEREITLDSHAARFGFQIGPLGLLIASSKTGEIVQDVNIYPVPNTAAWLQGIMNLRGNLTPVFDLRLLFGMDGAETQRNILIVDTGDAAAGFLIDGLPRSIKLGQALTYVPPVPNVLRDYIFNAFLLGGDIWLDVDVREFLSSLARKVAI